MGQVLSVFVLVVGIVEAAAFIERFRSSYLPLLSDDRKYLRYVSRDSSKTCPVPRTRRSLVGALVRGAADKIWSKKPSDIDEAKSDAGTSTGSDGTAPSTERGRKVSAEPVFPRVTEKQEIEEYPEESVVKGPTSARPVVKSPLTRVPPLGPEFVHVGKPVQDGSVAPDLSSLSRPPPPSPSHPGSPHTGIAEVAGEVGREEGGGAIQGVLRVVKSPLTRIPPITSPPPYERSVNDASSSTGRPLPKAGEANDRSRKEASSAADEGERAEIRVDGLGGEEDAEGGRGVGDGAEVGDHAPRRGPNESILPARRRSEERTKAGSKAGKEVSWAEDVKHIERGDKKSGFVKDVKFPGARIGALDGKERSRPETGGSDGDDSAEGGGAGKGAIRKKAAPEDGEKIEIPPPPSFPPPPVPPGKEDPGELRIRVERPRSSDPREEEEVTFRPPPGGPGERRGRGEATVEGRGNGGDVKVSQPPRVRDDSLERRRGGGDGTSAPKEAFWLIFSGEYTKAMSKEWHSGHFCCWQCDESLTGQRYVLRDDHPYCVRCYESVFANLCEQCNKTIGIDSKDLSYKDKHWHEACFLCTKCRVSLVDKQFGSKADKIYCGNCYDAQFASRCDGCGEIFRAGTKKMEYKTRQWHEKCFCCCVCKTPIGTKSFIPREQEIYCATCYEEKFATRCVKCNKIITTGGVTYKNEPWHRECFTCTHCSASLAGQRFTSRDEKPYCAECFGELFAKRCVACSRPITGIGGTRFISFEDRHWHNDCFICASCKTSLVGRGFITDGEDIICPECAKQKLM